MIWCPVVHLAGELHIKGSDLSVRNTRGTMSRGCVQEGGSTKEHDDVTALGVKRKERS
jgi:hypothetical protein